MFGRKLLINKHVNAIKRIKVDGSLLLTCKNCRALQECKLPTTKELPFLWVPTSKPEMHNSSWPLDSDISVLSQSISNKSSGHDIKNGGRERYKTLKTMFSEECTTIRTRENAKKDVSIQALPSHHFSCKGLQPIIDSQRLIQEELAKSQKDLEDSCTLTAKMEQKKTGTFPDHVSTQHKTSIARKQKNIKTVLFSKNKHIRLSKEKQFQKMKKVPGAQELAMERIADNLIEEWPLLFTSKVSLDTSSIDDSIYFDNNLLRIKTRGARLYRLQIILFKWASKIVWMDPTLEILQVTKHTQDNTIKIRWLTNGKPRLLYPLMLFGRTPSLRYMDFFSTLKVGENETVEVHRLSKLISRQNTQRRNPIMSLLTMLGLSGTSLPRLQEEPVLPSSSETGH